MTKQIGFVNVRAQTTKLVKACRIVSRRNELSGIWAYESINIMCVCISPLFAYTTARAF